MHTTDLDANYSPLNGSIHDALEVLFEETVDLANRLKNQARRTHRDDALSASGRILLQSLLLNGRQTVPALAHIRSTSRQNIQVLADRLAASGFIEFVKNPEHKRSDLVSLTAAGRTLLMSANEREADIMTTLLPHISDAEVRSAAALLRKLRLLLGGERKRRRTANAHSVARSQKLDQPDPEADSPSLATTSVDEPLPVNLL